MPQLLTGSKLASVRHSGLNRNCRVAPNVFVNRAFCVVVLRHSPAFSTRKVLAPIAQPAASCAPENGFVGSPGRISN